MTLEMHILLVGMACIGAILILLVVILAVVCDRRDRDKILTRYNSETPHPLASHFIA